MESGSFQQVFPWKAGTSLKKKKKKRSRKQLKNSLNEK